MRILTSKPAWGVPFSYFPLFPLFFHSVIMELALPSFTSVGIGDVQHINVGRQSSGFSMPDGRIIRTDVNPVAKYAVMH